MGVRMISTTAAPAAIGPYAQAVTIDGWLYTSGQIPLTPAGEMVTGGIQAQVNQVLHNLSAVLSAAGAAPSDVVKATIFMINLGDFQAVNEAYATFFGSHTPARSTVQVAALPRGAMVEIELVARIPD